MQPKNSTEMFLGIGRREFLFQVFFDVLRQGWVVRRFLVLLRLALVRRLLRLIARQVLFLQILPPQSDERVAIEKVCHAAERTPSPQNLLVQNLMQNQRPQLVQNQIQAAPIGGLQVTGPANLEFGPAVDLDFGHQVAVAGHGNKSEPESLHASSMLHDYIN